MNTNFIIRTKYMFKQFSKIIKYRQYLNDKIIHKMEDFRIEHKRRIDIKNKALDKELDIINENQHSNIMTDEEFDIILNINKKN